MKVKITRDYVSMGHVKMYRNDIRYYSTIDTIKELMHKFAHIGLYRAKVITDILKAHSNKSKGVIITIDFIEIED